MSFASFYRGLAAPASSEVLRLFQQTQSQHIRGSNNANDESAAAASNTATFWHVYGSNDTTVVAQHVFKTLSVIKTADNSNLPLLILSKQHTCALLRDILLHSNLSQTGIHVYNRIEIYSAEGSQSTGWACTKRASPGNLVQVEDLLFSLNANVGGNGSNSPCADSSNNVTQGAIVMCVRVAASSSSSEGGGTSNNQEKTIGIAYTDATSDRKIGVCEFADSDTFANFEIMMVQLGVRECVLAMDNSASAAYDLKKIRMLLNKAGIAVTERKKSEFQVKDIEQDLNRLLSDDLKVAAMPEFEMKIAMSCVGALITYLDLLSDSTNFGLYALYKHDQSQYMRLDATALTALNLFPTSTTAAAKTMSVYGLLDQCKTAQGSRLLGMWLKQPLMRLNASDSAREGSNQMQVDESTSSTSETDDLSKINVGCNTIQGRLDIVDALVKESEIRCSIRDSHLKNVPDLTRLSKKFQRSSANLQDVVRVYQVIQNLPSLITILDSYSGIHSTLLSDTFTSKLRAHAESLEKLSELVETTVDLQPLDSSSSNHNFQIKPEFDEKLDQCRAQMEDLWKKMEREAVKVSRDLGMELDKKLKFEKNNIYGYHFRLTRTDAAVLRTKQLIYPELSTQKAGVLFTSNSLRELSIQHKECMEVYEVLQSGLVKEILEITASYFPVLEEVNGVVAALDVLASFAHVSSYAPTPYTRPKFSNDRKISLNGARHPCLEVQEDCSFISNDVTMIKDESHFQIITGPNMGGKSTYIRTIGVISLMAQIGCFVPCDLGSELCLFDSILCRVGAGDSQLKGVSTFMAEMLETASILKSATSESLIIIDELGRGTSTHDGFGLAWSIAEHISKKIKCFALFATHFHELTELSLQVDCVKNRHVRVHTSENAITLLYKVEDGVCDQSFGIHVAELAQFPSSVVKLAKRKVDELESCGKPQRAWKCSKADEENGDALIKTFLNEFAGIQNLDKLSNEEVLCKIEELKTKFASDFENNPFIAELCSSLS